MQTTGKRSKLNACTLVAILILGSSLSVAYAETWRWRQPGGTVIFSDGDLPRPYAPIGEGPPPLRVPSLPPVPPAGAEPEPPAPSPAPVPAPRRGRRAPPTD